MKCQKCGTEFNEGIFCPECGAKYDEREVERAESEEKEKLRLEFEKTKLEQERLAVEKAAHKAELVRQENMRMEMEKKEKEELARTFNGVIYASIEEMKAAKEKYAEQLAREKNLKKIDRRAIWCFALSIATWPLVMTVVLWFPSLIVSIFMGIKALKQNTKKRKLTIAGLVIDFVFVLMLVLIIVNAEAVRLWSIS